MSGLQHDAAGDVERLRVAVDAFCRFIEGLPEPALVEKAWGPKEVLAHLIFSQDSYVTQAEAILALRPYELPQGRFEEVNAPVVAASRGVPVAALLRHPPPSHSRGR